MLSNTGGGNSDSSSGAAAGAVGDFESAAEAEVSLGFAFSAEVTANCVRIDDNAAAAVVATAINKADDSSPTSKYAVSAAGVDASSVKDFGDGFLPQGGLGLGSSDAHINIKAPSQGMAGDSIVGVGVVHSMPCYCASHW